MSSPSDPGSSPRDGFSPSPGGSSGEARPLRVVDVATFYGEKAGGIRTYLDAKQAWARREPAIDHTLVIPGLPERSTAERVEVPSVRAVATNGYRVPLGWGDLRRVLLEREPDVVIAHDPFWAARGLPKLLAGSGIKTVAVHHGAVGHDARSIPGSFHFWSRVLSREFNRVFTGFDAIMSAIDTVPEFGIRSTIPLRFGLDPVFAPDPADAAQRGDEVIYAGRIAAAKSVEDLIRAAALAEEPWPLHLIGVGPAKGRMERLAADLGIADRVRFEDFVDDRAALARRYRRAACVVLPGRWETFGLAAYEAAASGGSVVCCTSAGSLATIDGLAETFPPGPHGGPGSFGAAERARNLHAAIERARHAAPDQQRAAALSAASSWDLALRAELTHLRELVHGPAAADPVLA
ncbi:MAG: glycosyltransferase [Solirubrobacteraceae bacterium]|nr:glycosyltransferase [Solirubrobacteraceae bacterium]